MTLYTTETELTATQAIRNDTIVPTVVEVMSAYDYISDRRLTLADLGVTLDSTEAEIAEAAYALELTADMLDDTWLTQTVQAIRDLIIRTENRA